MSTIAEKRSAATPKLRSGRSRPRSLKNSIAHILAPSFVQMQALQAISAAAFVYALFFSGAGLLWWGVALFVYFLTGCLGLTVTMHRALTHRSFNLPRPLEILFTLFGAAGGSGSSIAWTAMHRAHHANVDGEDDPHSPEKLGWRLIFSVYDYDFDPRHAKDLLRDKFHLFVHRYYTLLLAVWGLGLAAIDWRLCVFVFLVPAFLQITVSNLTSLLTHSQGYRNFETRDESVNNPLIALLGWGEGWHNNHHAAPMNWTFQRRWWEIDPGAISIAALMNLGAVRRQPSSTTTAGDVGASAPADRPLSGSIPAGG